MKSDNYIKFLKDSEQKVFDLKHRNTVSFNISKYNNSVEKGKNNFIDLERDKNRASTIKKEVLKNLSQYLVEFENSALKNGIEVVWAKNSHNAISFIREIIKDVDAKKVVKSKSMISEEINFNEVFEKEDIICQETDLGEYIVQQLGEKPYHILTPAMHKSKEDISLLFNEKFNLDISSTPEDITLFVRSKLRKDFYSSDIGITGANFLLAKEGAVVLTENEGNGILSHTFPRVHIVLAGIEKILPSITDLDLFLPILSQHGTGQQLTVYNSVVFGPKHKAENDGPERMIVILLDNNRSKLYSHPIISEALACIRCGACLNSCPIYKNIGGHTYNSVYSGPIGSVITPYLKNFKEFIHLSFACTMCGKCKEVCPVKIDLPKLILYNRKESVDKNTLSLSNKIFMKGFYNVLESSFLLNTLSYKFRNFVLQSFGKQYFGSLRVSPKIVSESFITQWKENNNI